MARAQPGSLGFEAALTMFVAFPDNARALETLKRHPELVRHGPAGIDAMLRRDLPSMVPGLGRREARERLLARRALLVRRRRRRRLVVAACLVLATALGVGTFLLVNRKGPVPFGPAVAVSPDGKLLAAADDEHIYLWDITRRRLEATLAVPGSTASAGTALPGFNPDGRLLGVVGNDGTLYVWTVASRRLTATLTDPGSAGVAGFAFGARGGLLATFDGGDDVYLWDLPHKRLIATLPAVPFHSGDYGVTSGVAFSPDGRLLAVSLSGDSQYPSRPGAVIWDTSTRRVAGKLPPGAGGGGLAFSPDGATLALGDDAGDVTLWDVPTRTVTRTLSDTANTGGMCEGGQALAYSPDGTMLATDDGCASDSAFVWDPRSGVKVATLTGQTRLGLADLGFSADSKTLVAGSVTSGVELWNVATATITATLNDPSTG